MDLTPERTKYVLSTLALATFVAMIGNGIINPLITLYSQGFGASGIYLGVIFSSFAIARSIVTPIIGKISDRHERKRFMLIGMAAYAVFSLCYLLPSNVWGLIVVRLLHGAASGLIAPVVMAYASEIAPSDKKASSLGFITAARFFGFGLGPLIGGFVETFYGFQAAFVCMSVLAVVALILIFILVPPYTPKRTAEISHTRYRDLFRNKALMSMAGFRLFMAAGGAFTVAFLPLLGYQLGMSVMEVSIILTSNVMFSSLFQFLAGRFADKIDKIMLIMAGSLATGLSLVLLGHSNTFMQFLIVGTLLAAAQALTIPASAAITSNIGKHTGHGAAMGMWNFGLDIGVGTGPLLAGIFIDSVGYVTIFTLMGALTFGGMILSYALFVFDKRHKEYLS